MGYYLKDKLLVSLSILITLLSLLYSLEYLNILVMLKILNINELLFLLSLFDDVESEGNLTSHQLKMIKQITSKIELILDRDDD